MEKVILGIKTYLYVSDGSHLDYIEKWFIKDIGCYEAKERKMKVRQPLKIEPMEGTTLYSDH